MPGSEIIYPHHVTTVWPPAVVQRRHLPAAPQPRRWRASGVGAAPMPRSHHSAASNGADRWRGGGGRSGGNRSGLGGSRGMGGIFHIISSNVEGLALGPSVGDAILGRVGPFGGFGCLLPFLSRASRPSISLRLPWMYGIGRTDSLRLLDSADNVVSTAVHAKAKGVGYDFRPCPLPVSSNGSIFRISVFWGPIPSVHDQSKGGEDHLPPPPITDHRIPPLAARHANTPTVQPSSTVL